MWHTRLVAVTVPSQCWSTELSVWKYPHTDRKTPPIVPLKRITGTASGFFKFILLASCLTGVSAVEAEWIPQLLPQYCHFSSPLESPSPWLCSSTGTIRCHRSSTFCRFPADERHVLTSVFAYICVSWLCLSRSPCGLAAAARGDGISRGPGPLQAVFQVSAWGTGTVHSPLHRFWWPE